MATTLKEKHKAKILELRGKGLSVKKISEKLKINRGVTNSVIYPYVPKKKAAAKKIVKKAKKPKKAA